MNENTRAFFYRIAAVAFLALIVGLIIVDVFRGGDPATWVTWLAGLAGLGTAGLAAANTPTKRD